MAFEERRAVVGQPSGLKEGERNDGRSVGLTTVVAAVTLVVIWSSFVQRGRQAVSQGVRVER